MTLEPIGKLLDSKKLHKPKPGNFEGLPIRPSKAQTRLVIDNEYLERGYMAIFPKTVSLVYSVLAKYANYRTQRCFPAIATIMKDSGIKRRNTVIDAIKILEGHNLIFIQHSKGWTPNEYALLRASVWKEPNRIAVDTVIRRKNTPQPVSKNTPEQYQEQPPNSNASDTRSQLSKSYNEINLNKNSIKEDERKRLSRGTLVMLGHYYQETDIREAEETLLRENSEVGFRTVKDLLARWSADGKIKPIQPMTW